MEFSDFVKFEPNYEAKSVEEGICRHLLFFPIYSKETVHINEHANANMPELAEVYFYLQSQAGQKK